MIWSIEFFLFACIGDMEGFIFQDIYIDVLFKAVSLLTHLFNRNQELEEEKVDENFSLLNLK